MSTRGLAALASQHSLTSRLPHRRHEQTCRQRLALPSVEAQRIMAKARLCPAADAAWHDLLA